jgi:hypothetical protein
MCHVFQVSATHNTVAQRRSTGECNHVELDANLLVGELHFCTIVQ